MSEYARDYHSSPSPSRRKFVVKSPFTSSSTSLTGITGRRKFPSSASSRSASTTTKITIKKSVSLSDLFSTSSPSPSAASRRRHYHRHFASSYSYSYSRLGDVDDDEVATPRAEEGEPSPVLLAVTPSVALTSVLPDEVLLRVLSHLPPVDVRNVSGTCRSVRRTVCGSSAGGRALWTEMMEERWPTVLLPGGRRRVEQEKVLLLFRDGCKIGTAGLLPPPPSLLLVDEEEEVEAAVVGTDSESISVVSKEGAEAPESEDEGEEHHLNLSVLLGLASVRGPSRVDISSSSNNDTSRQSSLSSIEMSPNGAHFSASARQDRAAQDQHAPAATRQEEDENGDVDEGQHQQKRRREEQRRHAQNLLVKSASGQSTTLPAVQYNGPVGLGDRSIRSDAPLAQPSYNSRAAAATVGGNSGGRQAVKSLWTGVRRSRVLGAAGRRNNSPACKSALPPPAAAVTPFVSPFVVSPGASTSTEKKKCSSSSRWSTAKDAAAAALPVVIDLTPRLVAYFEVSILPPNNKNSNNGETRRPTAMPTVEGIAAGDGNNNSRNSSRTNHNNNSEQCIAIGLSTKSFHPDNNMPGWDVHSYGYHGDDGGVYHASGRAVESDFGPRFGPGDTVGCGVDYRNGGIFFALNGEFLGYAWTGLDLFCAAENGGTDANGAGDKKSKKTRIFGLGRGMSSCGASGKARNPVLELYPTVGVDSACPVACNFGEREFAFDLGSFVRDKSHADAVRRALGGLCVRQPEAAAPAGGGNNNGPQTPMSMGAA